MLASRTAEFRPFLNAIAQGKIEVFEDFLGRPPQENVDVDIATLERLAFEGAETPRIRVWANERCLVGPRRLTTRPEFGAASATLAKAGWPIVVRRSGGAVVPNGPGILNVSLFHQTSAISPQRGYEPLIDVLSEACKRLGIDTAIGEVPGAICGGAYDISVRGRKIAGCSAYRRQRRRVHWLAHAVVLFNCEIEESFSAVSRFETLFGNNGNIVRARHANLSEFFGGSDPLQLPKIDMQNRRE